jgi:hypothetical protein
MHRARVGSRGSVLWSRLHGLVHHPEHLDAAGAEEPHREDRGQDEECGVEDGRVARGIVDVLATRFPRAMELEGVRNGRTIEGLKNSDAEIPRAINDHDLDAVGYAKFFRRLHKEQRLSGIDHPPPDALIHSRPGSLDRAVVGMKHGDDVGTDEDDT